DRSGFRGYYSADAAARTGPSRIGAPRKVRKDGLQLPVPRRGGFPITLLVTGCVGFIGAKVSELLVQRGHQVLGVDNLNTAYDVRLKQWRLRGLEAMSGFRFTQLDITDRAALAALLDRYPVAAVVNLAARAGGPDMSVFRFIRWIAEGDPIILYGDGSQERDFTYVEDIARGTLQALDPLGYDIINLGSDRPVSIRQVIATLEQYLGRTARL